MSINIKDGEPTQKIPALKPAAARPVPAFSCSPPPSVGQAPFSPFPRRPFSFAFSPAPFFSRPTPPRPGPRAQSRPPLLVLPSFPNFPGRGLSPRLPASRSFRTAASFSSSPLTPQLSPPSFLHPASHFPRPPLPQFPTSSPTISPASFSSSPKKKTGISSRLRPCAVSAQGTQDAPARTRPACLLF